MSTISYWCYNRITNFTQPLDFWILSCGFVILVAPVTGIATLGFSIAMDESKGPKVVLQVCWDCFKLYLVASSPLVGIKETVCDYHIIVIVITAIIPYGFTVD